MKETIELKLVSMTGIVKFLKDKYGKKKTGKEFNISDVQGYVLRGSTPNYLGGYKIVLVKSDYNKGLYNLIKESK